MNLRTLLLCTLASCSAASTDAVATTTPEPATTTLAASATEDAAQVFGIDRVETACRAIELHAGNADRTRSLDVDLDAMKLGLRAGTHRLPIGSTPELRISIVEYAGARSGETDCTDAGTPNQPAAATVWTATSGELVVTLSADASTGRSFDADVELVDVVVQKPDGASKRVRARFADLRVGWLPG